MVLLFMLLIYMHNKLIRVISLSSIATAENIYMYISVALKTLVTQRADRLRNRLALHTGNASGRPVTLPDGRLHNGWPVT